MEDSMKQIHEWASKRLIVDDDPDCSRAPTIRTMYNSFCSWGGPGKALADRIPINTFGRHIRNMTGIDVRRRHDASYARGVRLVSAQDPDPDFTPRIKSIAPKLTRHELKFVQTGIVKSRREDALDLALATVKVISEISDGEVKTIAEKTLQKIHDLGVKRKTPKNRR